jgi:hypothetical protein
MIGILIVIGISVGCLAVVGLIMRFTGSCGSLAGNIRDD